MKTNILLKSTITALAVSTALFGAGGTTASAAAKQPNIVIIWGDD